MNIQLLIAITVILFFFSLNCYLFNYFIFIIFKVEKIYEKINNLIEIKLNDKIIQSVIISVALRERNFKEHQIKEITINIANEIIFEFPLFYKKLFKYYFINKEFNQFVIEKTYNYILQFLMKNKLKIE